MAMGRSRATYARPASRRTAFNLRAVALPGDHAAPADGERPRQARLSGASQGGRGVQRHSVTRFETHRREGLGGSSTPARSVRSSRRCSSTPPRGRNESYVLEPAKLTAAAAAARSRGSGASGSGDPQPRPLSRASGAFPLGELLRSSESAWRPTGGPVRRPGGPACPASGRRCFSAAGTSEWQLPPPPAGHQLRSAALVRGLRGGAFPYFRPAAWRGHF